ncbi:MAG: hypothetical protein FJ077_15480 [Cyanobacteria bacterium K_DeepCast_35m_m2_023]|nr:hypothetical protein [Cyanobacteria bacterium K_DeepCast_35m_m2_023]
MSDAPQLSVQLQAVFNRVQARLGSGLADAAASVMAAAEGAPARLAQEWDLFWEEVQLEAQRLDGGDGGGEAWTSTSVADAAVSAAAPPLSRDPQVLIDGLRARVSALSQQLDA